MGYAVKLQSSVKVKDGCKYVGKLINVSYSVVGTYTYHCEVYDYKDNLVNGFNWYYSGAANLYTGVSWFDALVELYHNQHTWYIRNKYSYIFFTTSPDATGVSCYASGGYNNSSWAYYVGNSYQYLPNTWYVFANYNEDRFHKSAEVLKPILEDAGVI